MVFYFASYELVCPFCKSELELIRGNEIFGVLQCKNCKEDFPLGNIVPRVPDLRPKKFRIFLWEKLFFKEFGIEIKKPYKKDIYLRVSEIPYYVWLLREEYSEGYESDIEREFLEKVKDYNDILCIGCGDGRELELMGKDKIGIDVYPSNIILSNSRGIKSILADLFYLPFKDNTFDLVLALQVLEYVPIRKTEDALREIYRVLKENGTALFSLEKSETEKEFDYQYEDEYITVKKHFHRSFTRESLRIFEKYFEIEEIEEDDSYIYVLCNRR